MTLVKLENYSQEMPTYDAEGNLIPGRNLLEMITYYARVSNPASQEANENPERLVSYLIRNHHWSPFEMVSANLEINTTRDIARQILRHRSFSFQEFSQRYADPTSDLAFSVRDARLQDHKNRQNSVQTDDDVLRSEWILRQNKVIKFAQEQYAWATSKGIAKEQARSVLPEGNTNSRLYMNGTLRSWIHYIELRTTPGTQLEHMEVAHACANAIEPVFPMIRDFVRS
jgi:thymidylate synthase (FAD)